MPYIENASNKIMEKYKIKAQYETESPYGDAIYFITIKGKALPFWIYGRDVTFIGAYRTKRVVFNADGTRCFLVLSAFYLF